MFWDVLENIKAVSSVERGILNGAGKHIVNFEREWPLIVVAFLYIADENRIDIHPVNASDLLKDYADRKAVTTTHLKHSTVAAEEFGNKLKASITGVIYAILSVSYFYKGFHV